MKNQKSSLAGPLEKTPNVLTSLCRKQVVEQSRIPCFYLRPINLNKNMQTECELIPMDKSLI